MTDTDKKRREALGRLVEVLVEDVLDASDEEILAEFTETRGDPAKNSAEMRALFEKSVLKANKDRLRAAKVGWRRAARLHPRPNSLAWQMSESVCGESSHPALLT